MKEPRRVRGRAADALPPEARRRLLDVKRRLDPRDGMAHRLVLDGS